MYLKSKEKYLILGIVSMIIAFLAFFPIKPVVVNNQMTFNTFFNLNFDDGGVFAAFAIGIISVLVSAYDNIKSYKSSKLVSIPENSANLLIDLEYLFNEYELYVKNNEEDAFLLLMQILSYWKEHQKVFRLLTPNFYKKFLKLWSNAININENDSTPEKNSKYIFNAIIIQLSDIAMKNENTKFSFIKPKSITDEKNIEDLKEDYEEFNISKNNFLQYINNISGPKTKKETSNKFTKFYKDLTRLFNELKKEIEEYD